MKKLVLLLFVSSTFAGLGFSSLSASVIKDGIVLASNDKCGGEKKRPISGSCGDSKCGDEEMPMYKKQKDLKCGSEKKEYKYKSSKCGDEDERPNNHMKDNKEKRCGS